MYVWDVTARNTPYYNFVVRVSTGILCFVDRASLYNLVNETNLVHSLFLVWLYLYLKSLHVSGDCGPIIRRRNCVCATLGTCYCVCGWLSGIQDMQLKLLEGKGLGYIHVRKGPNKVWFIGTFQPFRDAIKLFSREQYFAYFLIIWFIIFLLFWGFSFFVRLAVGSLFKRFYFFWFGFVVLCTLHTRLSSTQNNKYQVSHKQLFLQMMGP